MEGQKPDYDELERDFLYHLDSLEIDDIKKLVIALNENDNTKKLAFAIQQKT